MRAHFLKNTNISTLAVNGSSLYAGDTFGNVYSVGLLTGSVKEILPEQQIAPASICISPNGATLVVASPEPVLYSTASGTKVKLAVSGATGYTGPCAVDASGTNAYITYLNGSTSNVAIINLSQAEQTGNLNFGGPIAVSPSSTNIYIVNGSEIEVVDSVTNEIVGTLPLGNSRHRARRSVLMVLICS